MLDGFFVTGQITDACIVIAEISLSERRQLTSVHGTLQNRPTVESAKRSRISRVHVAKTHRHNLSIV